MNYNFLLSVLFLVFISESVNADSEATIFCRGAGVTLKEYSPYLGENSKYAQHLFVLTTGGQDVGSTPEIDMAKYSAFFLDDDVEIDIGGAQTGGAGSLLITAKNDRHGSFSLWLEPWRDESDGTVLAFRTEGNVTYRHGPLHGKNVAVTCTKE